jgi:hypothetical protein
MTGQQAVKLIDLLLDRGQQRKLNNLESTIVLQTWDGISYRETADYLSYDLDYIKHIAARLWKLLSKLLGENICKSNLRSVLDRVRESMAISERIEKNLVPSSQNDYIECSHGAEINCQNLETWVTSDRFQAIAFFGSRDTPNPAPSLQTDSPQVLLGQRKVQAKIQSLILQNLSKPVTPNVLMDEILSVLRVVNKDTNSINCLIVNCYF